MVLYRSLWFLTFLVCASQAFGQDVVLNNGQALQSLFTSKSNGKNITCAGLINNSYVSGRITEVSGTQIFTPLTDDLKILKAKLKSAAAPAKAKIQLKLKKLKVRIKAENKICSYGPDSGPTPAPAMQPTSTPLANPTNKPAATATPKPVATSTPASSGNFDNNGNVTSAGKIKFGIPSNLNANVTSGHTIWAASCAGCHSTEKTGRSFSFYKSAIAASPMFIRDKTDQDIANLTAYLRRFEMN